MSLTVRRLVAHAMSSRADRSARVGKLSLHLCKDAPDFGINGFAYDSFITDEQLVLRTLGAIRIYVVELRETVVGSDSVVGKLLLETLGKRDGERHSVDAYRLPFLQMPGEPADEVNRLRAVLLHHLEASVLQLLFSLDEIAGISPAISLVHKDYGCAVGAVARLETREPFAAAPMMRRQLALMRVGAEL